MKFEILSCSNSAAVPPSNTGSNSDSGLKLSSLEEEEDDELFSPAHVDQLVASFWSKVNQKIEAAISSKQESQQADQRTAPSTAQETGPSGAGSSTAKEEKEGEATGAMSWKEK